MRWIRLDFPVVVPADHGRFMYYLYLVLGYVVLIVGGSVIISSLFYVTMGTTPVSTVVCGVWGFVGWFIYNRWIERLHSRTKPASL